MDALGPCERRFRAEFAHSLDNLAFALNSITPEDAVAAIGALQLVLPPTELCVITRTEVDSFVKCGRFVSGAGEGGVDVVNQQQLRPHKRTSRPSPSPAPAAALLHPRVFSNTANAGGLNAIDVYQMVAPQSGNQLAFRPPPFASPATVLPLKKTKFQSSVATEALPAAPPQARLAILETPNKRTDHAHVATAAACPSQSFVNMDASVAAALSAHLSESTPLLPPPPRSALASVQSSVSLKAVKEPFDALDSAAVSPSLPGAPQFSPSPSSMSSSPLFEFSGEEQYQHQRQQEAYSRQQSDSASAHTGLLRFESHEAEMGNQLEVESERSVENDSDLVRPLEQLSLGDISPMSSYMPRASSRLASLSPHDEWNADGGGGDGDHVDYDCANVYDDSPHRSNYNHRTPHALPSDRQVEKRTLSGNSNRRHKSSSIKPTAPIFTPPIAVPFLVESKVESLPSSSPSSSSSSSRTQTHAAAASHSSSNFVHPLHFVLPPPPPPQPSSLPLSAAVRPLPLSAPLALPAPVLPKTARSFSATGSYLPLPLIASLRTENGKDSYHCVIRADSSEQSHHGASNDDGDLKSKSRDLHESDALSPLSASSASPPSAIGGGKKTSATALPFGLEARAHQTQNHSKNAFAIPVLNSAAAAPPRGRDESSSKSAAAKSSRSSGSGDRKSGRVLPYSPTEAALLSSDPIRFTPAPSRRPPPATKVNAKEDERESPVLVTERRLRRAKSGVTAAASSATASSSSSAAAAGALKWTSKQ